MSIKRILAAAAASVVAVSAMAVVASAAITSDIPNSADDGSGNFQIKFKDGEKLTDIDLSKVAAFEITMSWAEDAEWAGGKLITQTDNWTDYGEWSTADDGKAFSNAENGKPIKVEVKDFNADAAFVSVTVQSYGADINIDSVVLYDADGNALSADAAPETPADPTPEEKPEEKPADSTTDNKPNVDTGVEGVAAVVGVAAVAAGAMIVAKKRK